jgi:hypothetical protein
MLTFFETILVVSFFITMLPTIFFVGLVIVDDFISKVHRWQRLK